MNNKFIIVMLTSCVAGITGCCCFEPVLVEPDATPVVREATIPEFNSLFTGNSPDPSFNIATFKFPASTASSGDLPNDNRFLAGPWIFSQGNYPVKGLTAEYAFASPSNSLIAGDLIVDSIFISQMDTIAFMRVRGKLLRLPVLPKLRTDDAKLFLDEIRTFNDTATAEPGKTLCATLESRTILYGTDTSSARADYSIVVTDNGAPTQYVYPSNWPKDSKGNLLPPIKQPLTSDVGYYTLVVRSGDWFFYKAVNGMTFYVLVTNIQQGAMPPYIQRMTIKFAESYSCENCTP